MLSERLLAGEPLSRAQASVVGASRDNSALIREAAALRDAGHGRLVSYSRKVFIPLTHLCRDVCHYCTYASTPSHIPAPYMSPEAVLKVARDGARAGCKEALFTLGDKPERRYSAAREALGALGCRTTLEYVREMAARVLAETGLLPHLNPGVMARPDIEALKRVSVSQGLMLESTSERLCEKGGPHYGSPDKRPARRLETLRLAGELGVPVTSGILVGIGETREERLDAMFALRDLHDAHGHLQEVIIQNFRAKPGTKMADAVEPDRAELLWSVAMARLVFGPTMNIQAPPNLSPGALEALIEAGVNDWGGVSPLTPDYVNPEAPWPSLRELAARTAKAGKVLVERLAIYPDYALAPQRWLAPALVRPVLDRIDSSGLARTDSWTAGEARGAVPAGGPPGVDNCRSGVGAVLSRVRDGETLGEGDIVRLFEARGADLRAVCEAADRLRRRVNGDTVSYVVNRNINYTNVCYFRCGFCAFSKGRTSESLRGPAYDLDMEEIGRRVREAWSRGATEVCLQGGIHPDYTGEVYVEICRAVKAAAPGIHVHAFSPLEVWQGARTLGVGVGVFLRRLREAGLGTLPGTAAEILDDEVRALICPDKINTAEWLSVIETAHRVGLRTTSTIMFGHVERIRHWARHLIRVRALQARTGGITEFVPLPFVASESPLYKKGRARHGPTFREVLLMHAVARLALHPHIHNIQTSWVKMGAAGVEACLAAGANDLGGTLMNESITRAAGGAHGQEMSPRRMEEIIRGLGRTPMQRTTLYEAAPESRVRTSFAAGALTNLVNRPARRRDRTGRPRTLARSGVR